MKQQSPELIGEYRALVERYHSTLDLISSRALGSLDRMIGEAQQYARLVASLSPAPAVILDLGSGVGLPGIPIAVTLPGSPVILVERRRRRAAFLRIVSSQLALDNVEIVAGDVQELADRQVGVVTAQAVGSMAQVYRLTRHLHAGNVWVVSRKGAGWRRELDELEAEYCASITDLRTEDLEAHGTLVAALVPGGSACPP